MSTIFCIVDDKHIPLYRVMWVSATPHFCGSEDCEREGQYEVRLEQGESVWANSAAARRHARSDGSLARRAWDRPTRNGV